MSAPIDTRLSYLRYTTGQYILDDPTEVTIQRQTKVNKPGGGHDFPKINLPTQIFRLINQDVGSGISYGGDDGTARSFSYVLIAEYDADIDVNDTWTVGEQQYKVDAIIPDNGWERRAHVTCFAKEPEHG